MKPVALRSDIGGGVLKVAAARKPECYSAFCNQ